MGKINVKTSVLVASASLAATLCILMGASMIGSSTQTSPSSAVQSGWVMRDYQGKVAVFQDGNQSPSQVLDIYVNSLPEHDQELLHSGIRISDDVQLQQLIEDYTG